MSNYPSLLPPNSTQLERDFEQVVTVRLAGIKIAIRDFHEPDKCPVELLPWLAWEYSVDDWHEDWSEDKKRKVIKASVYVHRHKGTPESIKRQLAAMGQPNATLIEGFSNILHDGSIKYDTTIYKHGAKGEWAKYGVVLETPLTNAQSEFFSRSLNRVAPARCHLAKLSYPVAAFAHNSKINHDATYNYGEINYG